MITCTVYSVLLDTQLKNSTRFKKKIASLSLSISCNSIFTHYGVVIGSKTEQFGEIVQYKYSDGPEVKYYINKITFLRFPISNSQI